MPSDTPTILIVDDVATNRAILERMLRKRDLQIVMATNGSEALDILDAQPIDTVLLDIMMPVMNGFEVLEALQGRPDRPYVPIVVISALHDTDSVARCIELGAVDFLFKPVNWVLLEARLKTCLAQKALYDRERAALHALLQANQAKSEFVSMVSHELKNPLTAIRGYADMLLQDALDPKSPKQLECLQAISKLSVHMDQMLGDLSDLAQLETGQLYLARKPHRLGDLVVAAQQAVSRAIEARQQQLTVMLDPDLPLLHVDDMRIVQVLTNLLSNASKYTPAGGAITLTAYARDAAAVEIAVSDTGIGIQDDEHQLIFQRYFRSRDALARRERGTGLGLSITRLLVEAHGGAIWFESAYRQGTTFYLTLPIVVAARE